MGIIIQCIHRDIHGVHIVDNIYIYIYTDARQAHYARLRNRVPLSLFNYACTDIDIDTNLLDLDRYTLTIMYT